MRGLDHFWIGDWRLLGELLRRRKDIRVREGSALVDGNLLVQGAACANRVEGRARVTVSDSRVVIAMYEGRRCRWPST